MAALWHLMAEEHVVGSYRDHAYCLLRAGDPGKVMAELFGHADGCCQGKGGSTHLFDASTNFLGGHAIVAGMCLLAVGAGLSIKYKNEHRIVLCFFGDAAMNQGVYHEALNVASLYELPVVWVCEHNYYAIGTSVARSSAVESLARKAKAYGMPTSTVDGMDLLKMQSVARRAIAHARSGKGPAFIGAKCCRLGAHSKSEPGAYRSKEEIEHWKRRDPLPRIKAVIQHDFEAAEEEFEELDHKVRLALDEAVAHAEAGAELPKERLYEALCME